MKIPFTNYDLKISNKFVDPNERDRVIKVIQQLQQYRIRQDIKKWRTAIQIAEQVYYPTRYLLYQTYRDVVLDAHLSGLIDQRKDRILLKEFSIGTEEIKDERLTEMFRRQWFFDFMNMALDSIYWGYSLIQFGEFDTNKGFYDIELVPRINVKPEQGQFVVTANEPSGPSFLEPPYSDYALGVGHRFDLGLLMKAAFYTITKNATIGIWGEYTELFGIPPRILKTDVRDDKTRKNGEQMMENMSRAPWAVIDKEDDLDFGSTSGGSNSSDIFINLIELMNAELSKLILGHSAAADSTSGKLGNEDQAIQTGFEKEKNDMRFIKMICRDKLFPFMRNLGFKIPDNTELIWDNDAEEVQEKQIQADYNTKMATIISQLNTSGIQVDINQVSELMELKLTEKKEEQIAPMQEQIKNIYKH